MPFWPPQGLAIMGDNRIGMVGLIPMPREPLFRLMLKLRQMKLADQCTYLIACVKAEEGDTTRRRMFQRLLMETRTQQIRDEIGTKRRKP